MQRQTAFSEKDAVIEVRNIYTELLTYPIERSCTRRTECCQFRLSGKVPYLTKGEAMVAAHAWKAAGRKSLPAPVDGACPLFDHSNSRCLIYESRPFGCRTHFCRAAGGSYARRDVAGLIHQLEMIAQKMGDERVRTIRDAVQECL